jgi:hypothetical protein
MCPAGDTKGLVGPNTTWREIQWTKVRVLIRIFGLRPWYCGWWPEVSPAAAAAAAAAALSSRWVLLLLLQCSAAGQLICTVSLTWCMHTLR